MPVVVPEKNAIVLKVKNADRYKAIFPKIRVSEIPGGFEVALPHTVETMRILRNMKVNVKKAEVLRFKYERPKIRGIYDPREDQIETASFLSENPRAFCLSTPRVGKTASAAMAFDFLHRRGIIKSTLVICPLTCTKSVWAAELFNMCPHLSVAVLTGDKKTRQKLLAQAYDVFIINPDGVKVLREELRKAVVNKRIGCIVIDECTDYANSSKQNARWQAANYVVKDVDYLWGMTGTPGSPLQVYGQVKLINPKNVPSYITQWKEKTMYRPSSSPYLWLPKPEADELLKEALTPAIRFDKKDILDLPPLQYIDYECPLSAEQKAAYDTLRKEMTMSLQGTELTAMNAAVLTSKLLQISTGAVKSGPDGVAVHLDMSERLDLLDKIIEEAEYKVVIFAPFTATLNRLADHLRKKWTVEVVNGDVTGNKREQIFREFQNQKDPHVLLCHPKTTSFGIELSAADTIVFFGPPLNGPFVYQQAAERIHSVLQKSNSPTIIHMFSTPVERKLFATIKTGEALNNHIVNLFKEAISEAI